MYGRNLLCVYVSIVFSYFSFPLDRLIAVIEKTGRLSAWEVKECEISPTSSGAIDVEFIGETFLRPPHSLPRYVCNRKRI